MSLLPAVTKCSGMLWGRRIHNHHVGTVAMRYASKMTTKSTSELAPPSPITRRPAAPAFQSLTKLLGIPQRPDQVPVKRLWLADSSVEILGRYFHVGPRVLCCGVGTQGLRAFSSSASLSATPAGCTCGEQNATQSSKCPIHDAGRGICNPLMDFVSFCFVVWAL